MFLWQFGSDGSVNYPGWYIDDVVIWDAERGMTEVEDEIVAVPSTYVLSQNSPNPFNPVTEIRFGIPNAGRVKLEVYNLQGQLVTTLVDEDMSPGWKHAIWDGTNTHGEPLVITMSSTRKPLACGSSTAITGPEPFPLSMTSPDRPSRSQRVRRRLPTWRKTNASV